MLRLLLVCALVTGCAQMRENMRRAEAREVAEREAADDATCRSYGINFGTTEYAQCRMLLVNARSQAAANQAAADAATLAAMAAAAQAMQPRQPVYPQPMNTNCYQNGPYVQCRSY